MFARPDRFDAAGFALPWVLFILVILSLLAVTGFLATWLEGRAARAFSTGTEALYVAEGGLATALALAAGPTPTVAPHRIGRGTARVTFEQLIEVGPGERLFRVESEGDASSGGATLRRRVGRLLWVADPPRAPAALVAWGAVTGASPTGALSGIGVVPGCPGTPITVGGIATRGGPAPAFPALALTGSPPAITYPAGASLATETGLRWTELLAPYGPTPDATVPPDPWPGPGVAGGWPLIRLAGPATAGPGHSGSGILVVDGDLTLADGFGWRGLVLVGGRLDGTGRVTVRGALLAGLAGASGTAIDLGSMALDVRWDPCAADRAARRVTAPAAPVPGTWYEDW